MKVDNLDKVSGLVSARNAALRGIAVARQPFAIVLECSGHQGAVSALIAAGGGTTNPDGLKDPIIQAILALVASHFEAKLASVETELRRLGVEP